METKSTPGYFDCVPVTFRGVRYVDGKRYLRFEDSEGFTFIAPSEFVEPVSIDHTGQRAKYLLTGTNSGMDVDAEGNLNIRLTNVLLLNDIRL